MSGGGHVTSMIVYPGWLVTEHQDTVYMSAQNYVDVCNNSPYVLYNVEHAYVVGRILTRALLNHTCMLELYTNFDYFMHDMDVSQVFRDAATDVTSSPAITALDASHRNLLNDDIEQNTLPRFRFGMRDINSVMSSTYIVGQSIIEAAKIKSLASYRATVDVNLINTAASLASDRLRWFQSIVATQLDLIKTIESINDNEKRLSYELMAKHRLWKFTVLAQRVAVMTAFHGNRSQSVSESTKMSVGNIMGGVMGGAALGGIASGGNPVGMLLGAAVGGIGGAFS